MAYPNWPSQLPNPVYGATEGDVPGMIIRTPSDAGVAKQRLRYTAVAVPFTCHVEMTRAQYIVFNNFVKNTLKYVLPFNWNDMMTDQGVVTYRMTKKPIPTRTAYDTITVELNLERMP